MVNLHDLLLLMFNLSQMSDKAKVITLFHESITELFKPHQFTFSEKNVSDSAYSEEISTRNYFYGYLLSTSEPTDENRQLIQNAIQMLAVILDRLNFEAELKNKVDSLESMAQQQLSKINHYVDELKEQIEERKNIEKELKKSHQLIQNIIDNSPSLIYLMDLQSKFILVNREMEKVFGLSKEEIIGKVRGNFMPKEIAEQHWNNDLLIINSRQFQTFEEVNMESDGKHFYLTSKFPLMDLDGKVYAVGGISTDITDHIHTEEEISKQLDELRRWYEVTLNREGRVMELKQEVNGLLKLSGEPLRYESVTSVNLDDEL